MKKMKPILFNTDMVRAILDGRKTVTRRVVKPQPSRTSLYVTDNLLPETKEFGADGVYLFSDNTVIHAPYQIGDILYVRETWTPFCINKKTCSDIFLIHSDYCFKASPEDIKYGCCDETKCKWHPSIHMPKEAARIFLRVTNVRVERLQDIQERGKYSAQQEGFINDIDLNSGTGKSAIRQFSDIWNTTIKKSDIDRYSWEANPWVWVVEFERISKEDYKKLAEDINVPARNGGNKNA